MNTPDKIPPLFTDFPPVSKEEWIKRAVEDLKGADFEKKLVWNTIDNLNIDPFYTKEDFDKLSYLKNYTYNRPFTASGKSDSWQLTEKILVKNAGKANQLVHEALHMGSDGLLFQIPDTKMVKMADLLKSILPNINPIWFDINNQVYELINEYFDFIDGNSEVEPKDILGGLYFDPLKRLSLSGTLDDDMFESLSAIIKLSASVPSFRSVTIDTAYLHNSGAGTIQEIAFTLNILSDYFDKLTEQGIRAEEIAGNLNLNLAVGTDYFLEIAKFRALRILVFNLLEQYEIKNISPADIHISCESSFWTKTIYDPYVNMLRNTTEAMAGILGGCNSIFIHPFDVISSNTNDFSKRISRNINNILKEESYFDKVTDPASGSYYIETITDKLIERSLDLFRENEDKGGYVRQFKSGEIQKAVLDTKNRRFNSLAIRKTVLVGTNQYPNSEEKVDPSDFSTINKSETGDNNVLTETRASREFENLRIATDRYAKQNGENKRPKVFLSLIGENKVMRKARASFAWGFFGCAGYSISESNPSDTLFKAVEKAIDSKSDIVVICGADEDYTQSAVEYADAYKANHNGILIIAGNPKDNKEDLINAGVDDFIHIRSNIIESLTRFQNKLNIL